MIEIERLKQLLRQIEFTADLPESAIDECAAVSTLVDFAAGTTIFNEGAANEFLYVVIAGRVGLDISVPGRARVRVLSVGPGEMLAWSALLGGGTMTVSAIALQETQAVALPGARLLGICGENHEAGFQGGARQRWIALFLRPLGTHQSQRRSLAANRPAARRRSGYFLAVEQFIS